MTRKQVTPRDHPIRAVPKALFLVPNTPSRQERGGAGSLPDGGDVKLETLKLNARGPGAGLVAVSEIMS
jgi:hypothetical protein